MSRRRTQGGKDRNGSGGNETRDYINAFANAVALFGSPNVAGDAFAHMPALLVSDFDAVRSELWLWDDSSGSAYLTNAAGLEGSHHRDYSVPESVVGKARRSISRFTTRC